MCCSRLLVTYIYLSDNNFEQAEAEADYETALVLAYLAAIFDSFADTNISGTNSKEIVNEDGSITYLAKVPVASLAKLPKLFRNIKNLKAVQAKLKKVVVIGEDMTNRVILFSGPCS